MTLSWLDLQKDIELCGLAIERAADHVGRSLYVLLTVLNESRRWVFLPTLLVCCPILVGVKGGDALSVCFNSETSIALSYSFFVPGWQNDV